MATAVKEAVGVAVQEAVQAILVEVLADPALRAQSRNVTSPDPALPEGPAPEAEGGMGRFAQLCGRAGAKLRSGCRAGAGRLLWAGQAAAAAWRLAGYRVRALLLAGASLAAAQRPGLP